MHARRQLLVLEAVALGIRPPKVFLARADRVIE